MSRAIVALGSNLGDRDKNLASALHELNSLEGVKVIRHSNFYLTEPVGPPQPDYLNACAILEVDTNPLNLLKTLLTVEKHHGRTRGERWGPRTLDLDLLYYDDLIIDTPELQIPHPRIKERVFVLIPLKEIAPDLVDPVSKKTVTELLEDLTPPDR